MPLTSHEDGLKRTTSQKAREDLKAFRSAIGTPSNPSPEEDLKTFRSALGIPPNPSSEDLQTVQSAPGINSNSPHTDKPTPKTGIKSIYEQVKSNEHWAHLKYRCCDSIVTIAMFLQIVVGASVTAFGAGNSSHLLITCFGAANTALASLLAVLKSQGLPNRLRQDWVGWTELRQLIEDKDKEFELAAERKWMSEGKGNERLKVWPTIRDIKAKYHSVVVTCEANRAEGYTKVNLQLPK
jgi:hypothetical protein